MNKDSALKLALEALEFVNQTGDTQTFDMCYASKAINAIREALAQPEQDSVAMADYMALVQKYVALKAARGIKE